MTHIPLFPVVLDKRFASWWPRMARSPRQLSEHRWLQYPQVPNHDISGASVLFVVGCWCRGDECDQLPRSAVDTAPHGSLELDFPLAFPCITFGAWRNILVCDICNTPKIVLIVGFFCGVSVPDSLLNHFHGWGRWLTCFLFSVIKRKKKKITCINMQKKCVWTTQAASCWCRLCCCFVTLFWEMRRVHRREERRKSLSFQKILKALITEPVEQLQPLTVSLCGCHAVAACW